MVNLAAPTPERLDAVFGALASPKRRAIVDHLADGEASMSELARPLGLSLPALTKHLAVLERAGLLEHRKIGRMRRCRLNAEPIRAAHDWLGDRPAFWERHLDALNEHLTTRKAT
jgi:DNA-binding transcriptional ArsR family regulator